VIAAVKSPLVTIKATYAIIVSGITTIVFIIKTSDLMIVTTVVNL